MKRVVLCLALVGCMKESPERAGRPVDSAVAGDPHDPVRPVRPVRTTPRQLVEDFTRPEADGLALLDKYAGGATFTATIKTVGREEDGTPVVWVDVDGESVLVLDFAPPPPPLQDLRPGVLLTVTCKIGGASGALMMVTSCLVRDV